MAMLEILVTIFGEWSGGLTRRPAKPHDSAPISFGSVGKSLLSGGLRQAANAAKATNYFVYGIRAGARIDDEVG